MKTIFLVLLLALFSFTNRVFAINLKGVIKCKTKQTPIEGVCIINKTSPKTTFSGHDGLFYLSGNVGDKIVFKLMGYKNKEYVLTDSTFLNIEMIPDEKLLKSVNITTNRNSSVQTSQSSVITLTAKQMNNLPTIGGERDVIRAMQLMPGIKRGGDGAAGIFVRGGTADQNLVLMDGATVYNPSHILGFFSIFNNDALQEAKLYKGAFPANYGGRLSAVMDVKMRDGGFLKWNTEAGVGLLSAKVKVEGPILKDRISLLVATRRTYLDKMFQAVGNQLPYYFYDFNTKLNFKINAHQKISFSNYWGNDVLSIFETPTNNNSGLGIDFGTQLGNNVSSLKWMHTKNNALTNVLISHSYFAYHVNAAIQSTNFTLKSVLNDFSIKADYSKIVNKLHTIKFGIDGTRLLVSPNQSTFKGSVNETLKADAAQFFNNNQLNFFALHDYVFSKKITLNYGIRFSSSFNTNYLYVIPEPRLAIKYGLTPTSALKLAYNKMSQHVHFVSSSSALMPTDLWYPVTNQVKPQTAHQLSVSYEKELPSSGLFFQVESYYKWMQNLVEYKEGTQILLNNKVEDDLIQGTGKAYGLEIMISKKEGKFTGWVAYTLAWSSRQFNELNNGISFFTRYDRRHDFSVVGNYNFNKRMSFSANYVWASGSRVTPIVGQFLMPSGSYNDVLTMPIYGDRNSLVLSPTHRLDVNWVIKSKPNKKHQSEWHIGAYNVYNQTQAFKTKIEPNGQGNLNYKQIGLFGFIPSIAYNIKF